MRPHDRGVMAGLSLLATNRTFHFGLKQAAQSLADASSLVTIANEKSWLALFSDEITLTAILMLVVSLGTTKQQRKIHTMQTFNKKDNNC